MSDIELRGIELAKDRLRKALIVIKNNHLDGRHVGKYNHLVVLKMDQDEIRELYVIG